MIDLLGGLWTHKRSDMLSETVCIRHGLHSPPELNTNHAMVRCPTIAPRALLNISQLTGLQVLVGIGNGVEIGACEYSLV